MGRWLNSADVVVQRLDMLWRVGSIVEKYLLRLALCIPDHCIHCMLDHCEHCCILDDWIHSGYMYSQNCSDSQELVYQPGGSGSGCSNQSADSGSG